MKEGHIEPQIDSFMFTYLLSEINIYNLHWVQFTKLAEHIVFSYLRQVAR